MGCLARATICGVEWIDRSRITKARGKQCTGFSNACEGEAPDIVSHSNDQSSLRDFIKPIGWNSASNSDGGECVVVVVAG